MQISDDLQALMTLDDALRCGICGKRPIELDDNERYSQSCCPACAVYAGGYEGMGADVGIGELWIVA